MSDVIETLQTFNANSMMEDEELFLRHQIREVLKRSRNVPDHRKISILMDEGRYLDDQALAREQQQDRQTLEEKS